MSARARRTSFPEVVLRDTNTDTNNSSDSAIAANANAIVTPLSKSAGVGDRSKCSRHRQTLPASRYLQQATCKLHRQRAFGPVVAVKVLATDS